MAHTVCTATITPAVTIIANTGCCPPPAGIVTTVSMVLCLLTTIFTQVGGTYIVTNGAWEGEGKGEASPQLCCHHQADGVEVGVWATTTFPTAIAVLPLQLQLNW